MFWLASVGRFSSKCVRIRVASIRTAGVGAKESPGALCCLALTGTPEREQHEPFCAPEILATFSPMLIFSQRDSVRGVAHSAVFEDEMAQADRGIGPNPAVHSANAKIRDRRNMSPFNICPFQEFSKPVFAFWWRGAVRLVTPGSDQGHREEATAGALNCALGCGDRGDSAYHSAESQNQLSGHWGEKIKSPGSGETPEG